MLRYLIRRCADLNVADDLGRRAIHFAATAFGNAVRILANAGAEIHVKDRLGRTPVHLCVAGNRKAALDILLNPPPKDFDIEETDHDGWTALLWAARSSISYDDFDATPGTVIQFLLDKFHANIWACGKGAGAARGWSPLKVARFHGRTDPSLLDRLAPDATKRTRLGKDGKIEEWDDTFHESRIGYFSADKCSSCLLMIYGKAWKCSVCAGTPVTLCFKCIGSKDLWHDPQHEFQATGLEYADEVPPPASFRSSRASTPASDHGDPVPVVKVDEGSGSYSVVSSGESPDPEVDENEEDDEVDGNDDDDDEVVEDDDED
jgi:hypothetical protein